MRAEGWTGTARILCAFCKFSLPTHQKERLVSLNINSFTTDNNNPQAKAAPYRRIKPLTPNDSYRGRTAPLTSKRCILYIYSTNVSTKYFKHGI